MAPDSWHALLAACWRETAARSGPLLRRSSEHELLAYVGAVLSTVGHALVNLVHAPKADRGCEPLGAIWCAAHALDASALVWHGVRPGAGRRFGALGVRLQQRMGEGSGAAVSAAYIAATVRTASAALEQLALGGRPQEAALQAFEDAAVELARIGIQSWTDGRMRGRPVSFVDRTLTMHRLAAEVATTAAFEADAAGAGCGSTGDWLAAAIAQQMPAVAIALIEDPSADRVLRAEGLSIVRVAWVARGAAELLAVQHLDREASVAPLRRLRGPAHAAAAAQAAARRATTVPAGSTVAWRRHSLALARAVASYLRACAARDRWFGDTRQRLLDLLADSLAEAAKVNERLGGEGDGALRG